MKKDLSKEEMLKRLQELEEENELLRAENRKNKKPTLTKEDAFDALKKLIDYSTQTYTSLWESMDMSDRTIRNFIWWSADDASEKTYWAIWEYYSKYLRDAEEQLLRYRAYISAPDDEQRYDLYVNLSIAYDKMLKNLEFLIKMDVKFQTKVILLNVVVRD